MTENHGYNTPTEGTADWHIPLNENFSSLDTEVEIRSKKGDLSNYTPKDGSKFYAIDTGELFLGTGSEWNRVGVIPETGNAPPAQIRVYGASQNGARAFRSDYRIDQFNDIGEAIQSAHDDLVEAGLDRGGAIELPVGQFDFSTPVEFNLPVSLLGKGGSDWRRNTPGDLGVNTCLNWTGGSGEALTLRASSDSLMNNPNHVPGVHFEGLLVTNDGGSASTLIMLDGTDEAYSGGSLIPKFTMNRVTLAGASGPELHAKGTVFQGSFQDLTIVTESGRGMVVENSSGNTAGGPSQYYFYNPFFYSDGAKHSADIQSQQVGIFGGTVANKDGGQGVKLGFRGSVWSTNIEGDGSSGSIGATLHGGGPWYFHAATCSKWESGLSIGDPDDKSRIASNVRFSFASLTNGTEDVVVQDGSHRDNWTPLVDGLDITDKRLGNQNVNEKNSVTLGNHTDTITIPVDTVQKVSKTLNPQGQEPYDSFSSSIISTSDGNGGTVSDFALGEPIVQELTSGSIDTVIPVIESSSTTGAEATFKFEFKRYT